MEGVVTQLDLEQFQQVYIVGEKSLSDQNQQQGPGD